jgi:cytoskeleton protein RodZ
MSLTLGEKLRQAREARGITTSEVAEQTRIAPLYIESIENNDFRPLPGGIFNKGFVKSYAKYVGMDEQEALQDYAQLVVEQERAQADEPKTYHPEVLTDERTRTSSISTIIFAVVILGLMTWGILTLVRYIQENPDTLVTNSNVNNSNANTNSGNTVNNSNTLPPPAAPSMGSVKIEFKAVGDVISLTSVNDGKAGNTLIAAGKSLIFEPKERLKISYAKSRIQFAQLTINEKQIDLPPISANPNRNIIEFEINKDNLAQIWQNEKVSFGETKNANATR